MRIFLVLLIAATLGWPWSARAQVGLRASSEQQLIDWYYAAFFGTGVYRSGDRTVSVLQIPFAKQLQPLSHDEVGLRITVPVSFGFYDFRFDELLDGTTPHGVGTASVLPGLEADVPVTNIWTVKPYFNVGQGWQFSGGESAWIYAAGLKSLVTLPIGTDSQLSFGNQLTMSGYKPSNAAYQPLGLFVAGLNLSIPNRFKIADHATSIDYHLIYYYYFNRLRYPTANNTQNKVSEQGEFAISIHAREPVSLKLFDIDRVGIAFRMGGGITAVRLFLNLPY